MGQVEASVRVLVSAFQDDPVATWLFPDDEVRRATESRMFASTAEQSLAAGELAMSSDGAAVAVWLPLAAGQPGAETGDLDIERLPHLGRLATFLELAEPRHPHDRDHLYLPFLGVAPDSRGRGLGGALLRERLALADAEGTPVYLEASSPRNRPLYERHGFSLLGEPIRLPDGPPVFPMWREPK